MTSCFAGKILMNVERGRSGDDAKWLSDSGPLRAEAAFRCGSAARDNNGAMIQADGEGFYDDRKVIVELG